MRNSVFIKIQTVPLLQKIEYCNGVSEPHLEIRPNSLPQMFQFTDLREKRKDSFNQHSPLPFAARANLQVGRANYKTLFLLAKPNQLETNRLLTDSRRPFSDG